MDKLILVSRPIRIIGLYPNSKVNVGKVKQTVEEVVKRYVSDWEVEILKLNSIEDQKKIASEGKE